MRGLKVSISKSWSVVFIIAKLLLNHINGHIINLFSISYFLFLNFYSPYTKKKLFFSLFVYIYCYTPFNISPLSLPFYFPTTLYFTITRPPYFPHKKLWVLSLSLSLSLRVLFFLIILIKVDSFFFFLVYALVICFFNFPLQSFLSAFYSFGWILIRGNTCFFGNRNLNFMSKHNLHGYEFEYAYQFFE